MEIDGDINMGPRGELTLSNFGYKTAANLEVVSGTWVFDPTLGASDGTDQNDVNDEIATLLTIKSDGVFGLYLFTSLFVVNGDSSPFMENTGLFDGSGLIFSDGTCSGSSCPPAISHISVFGNVDVAVIPLPPAAVLFGTALLGIGALRRWKDKKGMIEKLG